jgi:CRP-like cAMP-binding protein
MVDPIPGVTGDQLTRALGEAVIRIWSNLPQEVQNHLFQEAVTSQGESIRSQLAVFLHNKHSRTADALGNPREATEPDSLGGEGVCSHRFPWPIFESDGGRISVFAETSPRLRSSRTAGARLGNSSVGRIPLPLQTHSLLALNGRAIDSRRTAFPLGTKAIPPRFKVMNNLPDRPRNRLLLALPSRNLKRLMPELEHIRCQREQVLLDADSSLDHVFFPESGVVSVVAVYADGNVIEMATIGREGCTGMQAFFGAKSSSVRLLVQIPGSAAKMSRAAFARAMESMPSFRHLMSAYIHAFLEQVLVSVACNGAHSLKERLARWLLMMRDRSDDDALAITQSLLAETLGVERPTITHAVRELERAGAIEHGRRQVRIVDRQRLVEESCECYQLVRARVAFHLPKTYT